MSVHRHTVTAGNLVPGANQLSFLAWLAQAFWKGLPCSPSHLEAHLGCPPPLPPPSHVLHPQPPLTLAPDGWVPVGVRDWRAVFPVLLVPPPSLTAPPTDILLMVCLLAFSGKGQSEVEGGAVRAGFSWGHLPASKLGPAWRAFITAAPVCRGLASELT